MPTFKRVFIAIDQFFVRKWKFILVIVLLLAAAHGIATIMLGRMVESELNKIREQGDFVSPAELAGPPIPDLENGAVVYEKIFELIQKDEEAFLPEELISGHEDYTSLLNKKKREADPILWEKARLVVDYYNEPLSMLDDAMAKPQCRFEANWEAGYNAQFPFMARIRQLARLTAVKALVESHDGNMDEAVEALGKCFLLNLSVKDDPILLSPLVRVALIYIASNTLRDVTDYGSINEEQAKELDGILAQIDLMSGYVLAMKGERTLVPYFFQKIRENRTIMGQGDSQIFSNSKEWLVRSLLWRPFLYADELRNIHLANKQVEMSKLPYRIIVSEGQVELFSENDNDVPFYALLSGYVSPSFLKPMQKRDTGIAQINGSRIFLGLLAYKDRFGSYPDTLSDLRSSISWDTPEDPFSGEDFIYKKDGRGFLLYSIGVNLRDDGGMFTEFNQRFGLEPELVKDDIFWQMDT